MPSFPRLFSQFILRSLARERLRGLLAVIGIALGVAVVTAIHLANISVTESFRAAVESVGGATALRVVGRGAPIDEERLRDLTWLDQYGSVSPVIEEYAMLADKPTAAKGDGPLVRNELVYVLGVDVLRDVPFRRYRLLSVDGTDRDPTPRELLNLLVDERAVIVAERLARKKGWGIGDEVRLAFGSRIASLTIRGVLKDDGPARTLRGNFVLLDIAAAQLAADRLGQIDYLDLKLLPGLDVDRTEIEIRGQLPPGLEVEHPGDQTGRTETMIAAFQYNLTALSSVALLVGLFLIYNTVSVSVAARRTEIGMLSACGASRTAILGLFLGEAAVLASLGALLGLGLGDWLSRAAVQATAQTVETFYIAAIAEESARGTRLSWSAGAALFAIAVSLATLAAALPAWRAATVEPLEVLRGTTHANQTRPTRWSLGCALLLFTTGFLLTLAPPWQGRPVFGFAAELLFMLGAAFLTPPLMAVACRGLAVVLPRVIPPLRQESQLAAANLRAAVPQTSVTIGALAMSLGMMIAIGVMVGSFRQTVVYWLDSILTADLAIKPVMNTSSLSTATIDAGAVDQIRADADVAAICWYSSRSLPYGQGKLRIDTTELDQFLRHGRILFKEPAGAESRVRQALVAGDEFALVSESFSLRHDRHPGDRVTLATPRGPVELPILAVYFDYASNLGTVLIDFPLHERLFPGTRPARTPFGLSVYLRPGADVEATRDRLANTVGQGRALYFVTNQQVRHEAMRIFESTFVITYALQSIAMITAGCGVVATLIRLILERRHEIALLSLVGATPGQLRRMIVIEAVLIGVISQAIGVGIGILLAIVLIYVINVQSFGWTIQFGIPWAFVAQSTLAVVASSALFGVYPAFRATGLDALTKVRET